ncbi:hypothetical protein [Carboxylicivirga sp. N1Y90]|uniref:hypothetical protein n=1 Tax=Carboxylicivirga fragile TaxID=3417571 RepID=UPI003D3555C3|nr:hypothetical protein [Marinilabiliaceae bacterium N1Y90]
MKIANKVVNVPLSGGLLGTIGSSPKSRLSIEIEAANKHGWNVKQVLPASSGSLLYSLLRIILLVITLFLYTIEPGYYLILEKDITHNS